MFLTIECDNKEFSHLLHKHPAKVHVEDTSFGRVHLFYPKPNQVALLLEIDPLRLTLRGGGQGFALKPYVNDRTYTTSSFFSVALNQSLRSALGGRCPKRPELVDQEFGFLVHLPAVTARGGEKMLRSLFEPLGYLVSAEAGLLDDRFPEWGPSPYLSVNLSHRLTLSRLLRHLYILLPVLDNEKHYWVGQDEVDKLLDKASEWLEDHPLKETIVSRYLRHQKGLARQALEGLSGQDNEPDAVPEEEAEKKIGLHRQRLDRVSEVVEQSGYTQVLDLGCGEGKLVRRLLQLRGLSRIAAMDLSLEALKRARESIQRAPEARRSKVEFLHGSLLYDDPRLHGIEVACLVEVIEHLEPDRLERVSQNLFSRLRPNMLVVTTPNRDYNQLWETLPAGKFRHPDHRFEWSRQEFQDWAESVKGDYEVTFEGLGEAHPELGSPSQMAIFKDPVRDNFADSPAEMDPRSKAGNTSRPGTSL